MFDGNGNWTSDFSAQADRDNGIKILASRFDNIFIADIKESFENCLTKDGQIAPIGNFNMGGQKITNVGNGTNDTDAVNKSQLDTKVDLTGTQTISGAKTFTDKVEIQGANGHILFHIPGTMYTRLQESANGLEVRSGDGANLATLFAGWSDAVNSIVTTTGINKNQNGFVKLGNGTIFAKGRAQLNFESTNIISLPYPMPNANYIVASSYCADTNYGRQDPLIIFGKTTTSFTVKNNAGSGHGNIFIDYIVYTIG